MKTCDTCGESYAEHIDYCFQEGDVLVLAEGVAPTPEDAPGVPLSRSGAPDPTDAPDIDSMDAPAPKNIRSRGNHAPTPAGRRRRSLIGRRQNSAPRDVMDAPDVTDVPDPVAARPEFVPQPPPPKPTLIPDSEPPESEDEDDPVDPVFLSRNDRVLGAGEPEMEAVPEHVATPAPVPQHDQAAPEDAPAVPAQEDVFRTPSEAPTAPVNPPDLSDPLDGWDDIDSYGEERSENNNQMVWVVGGVVALLLVVVVGVSGLGLAGGLFAASSTVEIAPEPVAALPNPTPREDPEPVVDPAAPDDPDPAAVDPEAATDDPPEDGAPTDVEIAGADDPVPEPGEDPPAADPWANDGSADAAPVPEAKTGTVLFKTDPSGALLTVDGEKRGTTPGRVTLSVGPHSVKITLDGHTPMTQNIQVGEGVNDIPVFELASTAPAPVAEPPPAAEPPAPEPPPAAEPEGVRTGPVIVFYPGRVGDSLKVDGKSVGSLPARIELSEGPHTFSLVGPAGDFKTTKTVVLKGDGNTTILHIDK